MYVGTRSKKASQFTDFWEAAGHYTGETMEVPGSNEKGRTSSSPRERKRG